MTTYHKTGLWLLVAGCVTACGAPAGETNSGRPTGDDAGASNGDGSGGSGSAPGTGSGTGSAIESDCEPAAPVLAGPADGTTVEGGSVTLEWSGGTGPYEVEVAFDAQFTDPVMPALRTDEHRATIDGLNGGYFYWRVRSAGRCQPTAAAELHVTCKPLKVASDPSVSLIASGMAWNAVDHEYGIVYNQIESGRQKILFTRLDRLGKVVFGPVAIEGPVMPDPSIGGYQSPGLVYVSSVDRWAVAYHREGDDQSFVTLFDDSGVVLATQELDDGWDSETQSVTYHPGIDRIITSTDKAGGWWNTQVQLFDASLAPMGSAINASNCMNAPNNGAYGMVMAVPELSGQAPSAIVLFNYRESYPPEIDHLFAQRVDLTSGELAWPNGSDADACAGKKLAPSPGDDLSFFMAMDWSPERQSVGVAYTPKTLVQGAVSDTYFTVLDPKTGAPLAPPRQLNTGSPGKALSAMPKVAWDGEEFLVVWSDGRDAAAPAQLRMTKLDAVGNTLGSGDVLLPYPGYSNVIPGSTARALVGHDRIHAMVSVHQDAAVTPREVWLCIEPAYR